MNILYIEDKTDKADVTQRELRQSSPHVHVERVTSQQEAFKRLRERAEEYDLVLTALALPDGDGLAVLKHIREQALPLAVVVITEQQDGDVAVTLLKAGANDYIVRRRERPAQLVETLESALHRYRAKMMYRTHPLRILYAEPDSNDIYLTCYHFQRHAPYMTLDTVRTAREVIDRLTCSSSSDRYDGVLLDYRLPGMNAIELIKELQQQGIRHLAIVLVTGQNDADVAAQALKLGASDYMIKHVGYLKRLPSVLENAYHRTRLMREQAMLRESEQRLRRIIESMPVLLDAFDEHGVALFWNKECERVTGYTAEEIVGNPQSMELLVPDTEYRQTILKQLHQLGHSYRDWEIDVRCKNGDTRTISWSNISHEVPIPGWWSWGIGVDVTQRRHAERALQAHSAQLEERVEEQTRSLLEAQEHLIRREKLVVLGQMAGSVGHELRNPLATISNAVYYLKMVAPQTDDTIQEYLEIIAGETRNAEKIILDLLNFARVKRIDKERIDVPALVDFLQTHWKPPDNVRLLLDIPDDMPEFLADRRHIEQVVLNLLTNACEAMPQGGTLTIRGTADQSQITVSVTDTGCGIPETHLEKLFEPLFTTKTKGIGLGLAISKNLIEANGGQLTVRSRENYGSAFSLKFPLHEEKG